MKFDTNLLIKFDTNSLRNVFSILNQKSLVSFEFDNDDNLASRRNASKKEEFEVFSIEYEWFEVIVISRLKKIVEVICCCTELTMNQSK